MNQLSWVEINLSNLKSNVKNLKSLLKPEIRFMAVVKSNAYGHGIIEVAKTSVEAGADWLGVVNLEEAIGLRQSELQTPIVVLGYIEPEDMVLAAENNISVPIVSLEQLSSFQSVRLSGNKKLKIHLKIETGINRLGLQIEEISKALEIIKNIQSELRTPIVIEGVYSHFASVEEQNINYAKKQLDNFQKAINLLGDRRYAIPQLCSGQVGDKLIKHISSSAATMLMPEAHFDMVRCGIAIYGLWPSVETRNEFLKIQNYDNDFLKPVLSYKTKIVQIKNVKVGERIGYGCTYQVKKPMTIAVIPIGYYEGLDRGLSNPGGQGEVLVCGQKCPMIGRICMNMSVVDITKLTTNNYRLSTDEEVVIMGEQEVPTSLSRDFDRKRVGKITADEVAEKIGTINYEIITRIPEHVKRVYK